jgi:hypothetical protein
LATAKKDPTEMLAEQLMDANNNDDDDDVLDENLYNIRCAPTPLEKFFHEPFHVRVKTREVRSATVAAPCKHTCSRAL